jgi:uncharacterized membrane protein YesL
MFKGFFNRMYNGNPNRPDVDPDDMPKNKFELFFSALGLRIGDLVKLNLIFFVMILPIVLWTFVAFAKMNHDLAAIVVPNLQTDMSVMKPIVMQDLAEYLLVLLLLLPLVGPPLAGLTYIARNYARDEHAWLWSDFKEQMKINWKQSMAAMFILAVVFYVTYVTVQFYGITMGTQNILYMGFLQVGFNYTAQQSSLMWIMDMLFIIFIGLFILSYMYVFPLLVTYKLKFGQIIRNSMMIALGRLPFTILFGIFTIFPVALALFLSFVTGYALLGLVLYYLLIGFALASFIITSYTNATFDKLLKAEEDEKPLPEDNDKEVKP